MFDSQRFMEVCKRLPDHVTDDTTAVEIVLQELGTGERQADEVVKAVVGRWVDVRWGKLVDEARRLGVTVEADKIVIQRCVGEPVIWFERDAEEVAVVWAGGRMRLPSLMGVEAFARAGGVTGTC